MTDAEVDRIIADVDTSESGYIGFSEFVVASTKTKNLLCDKQLESVFKRFDEDGTGNISKA